MISLTPLIDVVFILLIFFMLASSFQDWRTISLNTSARAESSGHSSQGAILIRIKPDGGFDLNGIAMSTPRLVARLKSRLTRTPAQRVLIQPERGVALQRSVDLLDRLHALGGRHVSFLPNH